MKNIVNKLKRYIRYEKLYHMIWFLLNCLQSELETKREPVLPPASGPYEEIGARWPADRPQVAGLALGPVPGSSVFNMASMSRLRCTTLIRSNRKQIETTIPKEGFYHTPVLEQHWTGLGRMNGGPAEAAPTCLCHWSTAGMKSLLPSTRLLDKILRLATLYCCMKVSRPNIRDTVQWCEVLSLIQYSDPMSDAHIYIA